MKKEQYYNKTLKELEEARIATRQNFDNSITRDLLVLVASLLIPYPMNILLFGAQSVCCFNEFRELLFWLYNGNHLYLNSFEYNDVYKVYKIVLEELSYLFRKMELDNEMKIFAGYYYLLRNGYLSVEHQFCYRRNVKSDRYLYGINIMEGYGNCLNIGSMFTDLLKQNNYEAYNLSMMLPDERELVSLNLDFLEMENKETLEKLQNEFKDDISIARINHVVTLVKNKIHSYVIDPTNNTIFLVDSEKSLYQENFDYYAEYNKLLNLGQRKGLIRLLKPTDEEIVNGLSGDYHKVYENCSNYIDVFEKFYKEHKCLYEEVVEKKKILIREGNLF